jgi:glycosyltransferase involved in cell wall biosynthesis
MRPASGRDVRLLLATDHYLPFIGGAHRQTHLLARHMVSRGHEVAVVTPWHGGLPTREEDEGIVVHRVRQLRTVVPALVRDSSQRHQPPFPDPVSIRALRRVLRETRPDLVHVNGWLAFSLTAAMAGQRIPLLVSAREYTYFCATRTMLHQGLPCSGPAPRKCLACAADYYGAAKGVVTAASVAAGRPLLARRMTGLHSVSTYVHDVTLEYLCGGREAATERGLVQATIPSVLDGNVDVHDGRVDDCLARLPREPYVMFVGAFREAKGLNVLFDAYARLDAPPPLVLMGTIKRDAPAVFPPDATIITDVPHAAVMAAWEGAMFGVMPSNWPEPLGMVLAEALSMGRPVIGTQIGGHADIVDETCGILVPQGDAEALAEAMRTLIDDPELRGRMGLAARERARTFAAEAVLPRYEQLYRSMLAQEAPAAGASGDET